MFYKVTPFGYFGRVTKVSRGPWFREMWVEEDGLEYFYVYNNGEGMTYLLSNNIPVEEREKFQRLYYGLKRNGALALFGGLWLGLETILRVPYFKGMAIGWRALSLLGLGFVYQNVFMAYNAQTYGPIVGAFLRKYATHAKHDTFEITDRKREFFDIDTSDYMSYNFHDLGHDAHAHHGPQPDGESMDSTWLVEMDKFLRGEENKFKEHKNFVNYKYDYIDKSYPSAEKAHNLIFSPLKESKE